MVMRTVACGVLILAALLDSDVAVAEEPRVNVYNGSDYISPDTIPKFEAETADGTVFGCPPQCQP
jgi:spermidine/putrescine-binding protein